ncbi:hypothetical protein, partial [Peribacillus simplex]|uniref:hypothetical protein n=1 Tax=Peribacillus simplex TaxID=1478 RepID=UPI003D2DD167
LDITAFAADSAYKIPVITSYLFGKEITPALPYTRPRTKEGSFRKFDYVMMNIFIVIPAHRTRF